MLKKLLKYEFRSIGRQLIPLYLGVLGLAVVTHFFWFGSNSNRAGFNDVLGGIPAIATMLGYVAVCVALCVITLLLIIQRFYKGLLTEEGYLMFTLPCRTWQLIAAKSITASAMIVVGSCVGFLSALVMMASLNDWFSLLREFADIPWKDLFDAHALWPLYIVETAVLIAVNVFASVGHMYVSIALGHLSNKHRIPLSILAYIGINIAVSSAFAALVNISDYFGWDYALNIWFDNIRGPWAVHLVLLGLILLSLIPAAAYFFGTNWILSKKLNLE